MIRIFCRAADAILKETQTLTSGMTNYPEVVLTFSQDWDGFGKAVVVRAGTADPVSVLVTNNKFIIPAECLAQHGVNLSVGISGTNGVETIPTIWCAVGEIYEGADIDEASNIGEATPTLVEQMLGYAGDCETSADASADSAADSASSAADAAASAASSAESAEEAAASAAAAYQDAEVWAKGTRGGVPVEEGEDGYHDNAKYYSEQSSSSATTAASSAASAMGYASSASSSKTAAQTAQGAAETAQGKAETAASNAVSYETLAYQYSLSADSSASSAASSASSAGTSATAAANSATSAAGSASSAESSKGDAAGSATAAAQSATSAGSSASAAETYATNAGNSASSASSSASAASADALEAEGYAVGKQNGTDVGSSSPYYHNNAKYYKEQAAASATSAESAKTAAQAAQAAAETAAATFETDTTLAVSGKAADAKVTGDEITGLKTALNKTVVNYSTLTKTVTYGQIFEYTFVTGKQYFVYNKASGNNGNIGARTCTSDGTQIQSIATTIPVGTIKSFIATSNASYIRLYSDYSSAEVIVGEFGEFLGETLRTITDTVAEHESEIELLGIETGISSEDVSHISSGYTSGKYVDPHGDLQSDSGSKASDYIPVTQLSLYYLKDIYTNGTRCVYAYDSSKNKIAVIKTNHGSDVTTSKILTPALCSYIRLTAKSNTNATIISLKTQGIILSPTSEITITDAITAGYETIALESGKYFQTIDIANGAGKTIKITSATKDGRPKLYNPNAIIGTSATNVSGTTKVKSITTDVSFADGLIWIYQDDVNDESTEISDDERHPLQRGQAYRCTDTRIVKCTSNNTEDAIAEIDAAETYKWFLDSTNHILYFSSPETVSENNPICYSNGGSLFSNNTRVHSVELIGIEIKYQSCNIGSMTNPKLIDCKCSNVLGWGAFAFDSAINATFIRCEASNCHNGTNGDGFNADGSNTGDPLAKQYTDMLIECWSHDNADDGYSTHKRAESTIIGGLYEYNGKAGVTPSYGCHCECHDVYSRKNYNGFYYTGEVAEAEGGKYGQMICYNCVAEDNTRGDAATKAGFRIDGSGNKMILVNCKAIGNGYGFASTNANCHITLIDCGALNNTQARGSVGNYTIKNTTLVT